MNEKTISTVLQRAYFEAPEKPAVHLLFSRQPDLTLTYGELVRQAAGWAGRLAEAGVQPGEVVPLIFNHGPDLVCSFFGAALRGAIPAIMPFLTEKLDPGLYRAALASLFAISAPAAVITYPEFAQEVESARAGSSVRAVLLSGGPAATGEPDFSEGGTLLGLQAAADEIVLLQHSSGTTGLQKGVALSHRAVFNQLESYGRALNLQAEDVVVSWLPLYHDMGLIAGFLLPTLNRLPLVLLSPFDWVRAPYKLLQAVSRYRGTLSWLPNFAYNFCAQKIRARNLEGVDLSCWRAISNCSEPMHWSSQQMFLKAFAPYGLRPAALATCYAMAENVFAVSQGGIETPVRVDPVEARALAVQGEARPAGGGPGEEESPPEGVIWMLSAGKPIDGTQVKVLDTAGRELPERRLGEIALRSNCMLSGYYHRPDLTEKAFQDGWYLTGDLGYLADGEVYITGRKKDLIIVGGKNIYPQDIERLAGEAEGVHAGRVVAFGVYNEAAGTEEVVVVAETDGEMNEAIVERIGDEIRRRVTRGSDITLRSVAVVGRGWLLKTSSGKIARGANREKYLQESQSGSG